MPATERTETLRLERNDDIVRLRQLVRARTVEAGFSLVEQTKIITAASETQLRSRSRCFSNARLISSCGPAARSPLEHRFLRDEHLVEVGSMKMIR